MEYRKIGTSELEITTLTYGSWAIGGWMWGGADNKKAILAYSPLQRGILTGKIKPEHSFNSGDSRPNTPYYQEPNFSRIASFIENIRSIAESKNISLAQLVLNWTMHQPGITSVITGARNPQQVEDNAYAASVKLSSEEINMINQELDKITIEK